MTTPLRGIVPPLLTPLLAPDVLDRAALRRLIDRVLAGGAAGVFVLGTTGEGPGLALRVRDEVVAESATIIAGRVPLLVGVTDTSLGDAVRLSRHAAACGATAVVSAPPFYFPLPLSGVTQFWRALADASPLPVYLYNMPACVGVNVTPDAVAPLTEHSNIIGVKDSAGDLRLFAEFLQLRRLRPDWSFFVGPEHLLQEAVLLGGDGGVHGGANLAPRLFVDWFQAVERRDLSAAEGYRQQAADLSRIYDVGGDFLSVTRGLKCALSHLGVCSDVLTEPFQQYSGEQRELVGRFTRELWAEPSRAAVLRQ